MNFLLDLFYMGAKRGGVQQNLSRQIDKEWSKGKWCGKSPSSTMEKDIFSHQW